MTAAPLTCTGCGTTAPATSVLCPACHRLFHASELRRLLAEADASEAAGHVVEALLPLRAALGLLPQGSTQARTIADRIAALEAKLGKAPGSSKVPAVLAGLGAFGAAVWKLAAPLLFLLSKAKFLLVGLFQAKTLLSMIVTAGFYRQSGAPWMVAVVIGSIYVHEMGHVFAFQRYGIVVSAPMFIPGIGAFVRGTHYPRAAAAQADVALAGPVWGAVTGYLLMAIAAAIHSPTLALGAMWVAEVNQFNLLPVWQLDGNRALQVLAPRQRILVGAVGLAVGLASGSIMGSLAAAGHVLRGFVLPGDAPGEPAVQRKFIALVVALAFLRGAAAWLALR